MAATVDARQNLGRMGNVVPMDLTNDTMVMPLKPGHGIPTGKGSMFGEKRLLKNGYIPKFGHSI